APVDVLLVDCRLSPGGILKPGVGVEQVVAEKLESVAVQLVRAPARHYLHDAAGTAAVFSRHTARDHFEFSDGLHGGDSVSQDFVAASAVNVLSVHGVIERSGAPSRERQVA